MADHIQQDAAELEAEGYPAVDELMQVVSRDQGPGLRQHSSICCCGVLELGCLQTLARTFFFSLLSMSKQMILCTGAQRNECGAGC